MKPLRPRARIDQLAVHHQGRGTRALTRAEVDRDHRRPGRWGEQRADGSWPMPSWEGAQYHVALHAEGGAWRADRLQPFEAVLWGTGNARPERSPANTRTLQVIVLWGPDRGPLPAQACEVFVELLADLLEDETLPSLERAEQVLGHREISRPGHTACPGSLVELDQLRGEVADELERRRRLDRMRRGLNALGTPFIVEPTA